MATTRGLESVDINRIVLNNYMQENGKEAAQYLDENNVSYDEGLNGIRNEFTGETDPYIEVHTDNATLFYRGLHEIRSAVDRVV